MRYGSNELLINSIATHSLRNFLLLTHICTDMWTLYYRCEKDSPEMPVMSPKETEVGVAKKEKKVKKKIQREPETSGGSEQVWGQFHVTNNISHVT